MMYKALDQNEFTAGNYRIVPIRQKDMEQIRLWRNNQMTVLRQSKELTAQDQQDYFINVVKPLFNKQNPKQLLFSYLMEDQLIGYGGLVNISWRDKRVEMSFLMASDRAEDNDLYKEDMGTFISLMKKVTFEELKFNRMCTETYDFRSYHIQILELNGYHKEGVLREHIIEFGEFHDSIMHSIIKKDL